jgi:hypothetical protein
VLDSLPDEHDGQPLYDGTSVDDVARSVFLAPGEQVNDGEEELTVEATLLVLHHPAKVIGGTFFPAFWEYRLTASQKGEARGQQQG